MSSMQTTLVRRTVAPANAGSGGAAPSTRPPHHVARRVASIVLPGILAGLAVLSGCGGGGDTGGTADQLGGGSDTGGGAIREASGSAPLLQKSDLVYVGSFRVPEGSSDTATFEYGGHGLGLGAGGKSLWMAGHDWYQRSAEISIPQLVNSSNLSALNVASLLQPFKDATEGKLNNIGTSDAKIGGHMVYNGKLYIGLYSFYDAGYSQNSSHLVRPTSLATTGQVQGPFKLGDQSVIPRWLGGYMGTIPPEWQSQFGGPALTGMGGVPIASAASNGPTAAVFDPATVGVVSPAPATVVVGYPLEQSLNTQAGYSNSTNPMWNLSSEVRGVVFPEGTRSVLFFGRHGVGTYCYGEGAACGDPADDSKGNHAYPYVYQVWAYDANDLVAVKQGRKQPHQVLPYTTWTFTLPFQSPGRWFGGAVWDPSTRRIYVSQKYGDGAAPVIHVFRVDRSG